MLKCIIYISILFCSCNYKLVGTVYSGSTDYRSLSIKFIDDSSCQIRQEIFCQKIDSQYRQKTIVAKYHRISFVEKYYKSHGPIMVGRKKSENFKGIVVNNIECKNCDKYVDIPGYFENGCLEERDSIVEKIVGFEKLNNFIKDTLILHKGVIYFGTLKLSVSTEPNWSKDVK